MRQQSHANYFVTETERHISRRATEKKTHRATVGHLKMLPENQRQENLL